MLWIFQNIIFVTNVWHLYKKLKKMKKSSWQINLIMITYILSIQKVSKDNDIRIEEAISVKDKY